MDALPESLQEAFSKFGGAYCFKNGSNLFAHQIFTKATRLPHLGGGTVEIIEILVKPGESAWDSAKSRAISTPQVYLYRMQEAEKRDHRLIAKKMNLFHL